MSRATRSTSTAAICGAGAVGANAGRLTSPRCTRTGARLRRVRASPGCRPEPARRLSPAAVLRWLVRQGTLSASPAAAIRSPKAPRSCRRCSIRTKPKAWWKCRPMHRSGCAIAHCGAVLFVRPAVVGAVRPALARHRPADALVNVLGKGSKQRSVPVGRHARAALQECATSTGAANDAPVFPDAVVDDHAARGAAAVATARAASGLFKRVHPHLLRHRSPATSWNRPATCAACRNAGACDIATTQIYTHLDYQHLAKVYDAAHPGRSGSRKPLSLAAARPSRLRPRPSRIARCVRRCASQWLASSITHPTRERAAGAA